MESPARMGQGSQGKYPEGDPRPPRATASQPRMATWAAGAGGDATVQATLPEGPAHPGPRPRQAPPLPGPAYPPAASEPARYSATPHLPGRRRSAAPLPSGALGAPLL